MDMTGERRIPARRANVWEALNNPDVLKASIPGCESLERLADDQLRATAAIKIGPIAARFTGKVQLLDLDPPNSYRIEGEGQGGVAGFAKGGAAVRLADDGEGTLLTYDVKAQVGGKIAQLGARLIDATAKQMADAFFNNFSNIVAAAEPQPAAPIVATSVPSAMPEKAAGLDQPIAALPAPPPSLIHVPAAAPAISLFSLIPSEIFGLPIVAWIGIVLYAPIALLLLSAYL